MIAFNVIFEKFIRQLKTNALMGHGPMGIPFREGHFFLLFSSAAAPTPKLAGPRFRLKEAASLLPGLEIRQTVVTRSARDRLLARIMIMMCFLTLLFSHSGSSLSLLSALSPQSVVLPLLSVAPYISFPPDSRPRKRRRQKRRRQTGIRDGGSSKVTPTKPKPPPPPSEKQPERRILK